MRLLPHLFKMGGDSPWQVHHGIPRSMTNIILDTSGRRQAFTRSNKNLIEKQLLERFVLLDMDVSKMGKIRAF
ncbi:MAG TPA: hypothetical protein DCM28_18690 [Phycisphaerales bacterium]|nr:hypothetical protein [Phycisphaerales bacterium]HCD34278.1 hypothetical protein [Phycisphaerales bacterium]